MLALWWAALHLLLFAAVLGLGVSGWVKLALAAVLGAHCVMRRPRAETRVVLCGTDGCWSLPEIGVSDLRLGPATIYTHHWVRLVLVGGAETFDMLLLQDQFDHVSWRILQARLRGAASTSAMLSSAALAPPGAGPTNLR